MEELAAGGYAQLADVRSAGRSCHCAGVADGLEGRSVVEERAARSFMLPPIVLIDFRTHSQ